MNVVRSSVYKGRAFEQRSLLLLEKHLSMSLRRVGGKSDGGIDLQGWWWLPPLSPLDSASSMNASSSSSSSPGKRHVSEDISRTRLRVFAQCKATSTKLSPNTVREMEGVLSQYTQASRLDAPLADDDHSESKNSSTPCVALMISQAPFTRSTILRAISSTIPFFLLHLPPVNEDTTPSDPESSSSATTGRDGLGAVIWNQALHGSRGLLRNEFELRWERNGEGNGRPGLWWQGRPMGSWVPPHAGAINE